MKLLVRVKRMQRVVVASISFYRKCISPFLGNHCRFFPSCSEYAMKAVNRFGVVRGGLLAISRILRCHPWNKGGFDPVPEEI